MARPLRICYEGAVYRITLRGNAQKAIFKDDVDRERFLLKLKESLERYEVRLYLYCLMTNHAHFVLETPRGNLSRFMQRFQTAYTVYYNRRHNRHGHLLQGRFGASVVDEDGYILKLSRYVHLNPVYIKAVKALPLRERIEKLRCYRWSSYRSYIGKIKPLAFVDEQPVLAMMSRFKGKQRSLYRRFVEAGISEMDTAFIEAKKESRLGIGSGDFHDRLAMIYDHMVDGASSPEDVSFRRLSRQCSQDDVLGIVCEILDLDRDSLQRRQRDSSVRALAAFNLCTYSGLTQREVADVLGLKSGAAVSYQLKRLSESLKKDAILQRQQKRITKEIERLVC